MPDSLQHVTDPFAKFQEWMAEAWTHEPEDANAMTLATTGVDGMPSARIVLLKGFNEKGFAFYTNYNSAKGQQLLAWPRRGSTWALFDKESGKALFSRRC